MKKIVLAPLVILIALISGCGNSAQSSSSPSQSAATSSSFEWSTDALYEAMLDDQLLDSWGYKNVEGVSAVDEFAVDSGNHITDYYSKIKPSSCEVVASLTLSRTEIGAKYYSRLDHYDKSDIFKISSFLLYTYTFESPEQAQGIFSQFKESLPGCSTFNYAKGSEVRSYKLWDQPAVNEANRIIGSSETDANAFGINGSAIWALQVISRDSVADAEAIAEKAAIEIDANLSAIQGQ